MTLRLALLLFQKSNNNDGTTVVLLAIWHQMNWCTSTACKQKFLLVLRATAWWGRRRSKQASRRSASWRDTSKLFISTLGVNSLFLGQNYPMMVKADPAAVDTTLLPFMRSNCIYTSDISVVTYPGRDIVGRFSLDDQSCVGLEIYNSWPFPENHLWFKASVSNAEDWLSWSSFHCLLFVVWWKLFLAPGA